MFRISHRIEYLKIQECQVPPVVEYRSVLSAMILLGSNCMSETITEVRPFLCISGSVAVNPDSIRSSGITAIVNCAGSSVNPPEKHKWMDALQVDFLGINVQDLDGVDISKYFELVTQFIERNRLAGGKVLVHCHAGVSRSTTFILAYLITQERIHLKTAYKQLVGLRPVVLPNAGFFQHLLAHEMSELGRNSDSAVTAPPDLLDCPHIRISDRKILPTFVWDEIRTQWKGNARSSTASNGNESSQKCTIL